MSGLEPLAALGLVCNVLQLVEVGLKTATLCKNAYRTGEPDPELSVYAQNLADTASGLSQSLELSQQPLNLEDARLLTLARNCRDAEAEWRKKTPSRFLSQQQPRKRDRLGAAFRGVINKPEIDRLEGQLQKAKESLEADLLVGVFKRFDISKVQTDDLQVKLETLLQATSVSETKLHDLIQSQVTLINSQLSDHILRAEASTKAHVTTELARHESRLKSHADQGKGTILTKAEVREISRRENEAYERLLRSFQYPDMNHRRNEIHSSHASTFHWIFEGENSDDPHSDPLLTDASDPGAQDLICSSFVTWLKSPEDRYWISGRPGTGKSVLMKFIISHQQTMNSLRQWQPDVQILAHFFWKVGSPMQSSYKGFLCSLAYQLCSLDKGYFMGCLPAAWSRKTGPGDWDNKDLQSIIASNLSSAIRPSCLFIDGIDEFMDDDGVGMLTDLLDSLQRSSRLVKICMSSRPEQAIRIRLSRDPDLKMQDLTQVDIQQYVRATLRKEVTLAASSIFVEDLVRDISFKAEGVFLWAVLVTRSIARRISNGDSKDEIHKRLTKTPKKLYELYLDMWNRLGEDSNIYQRSTALIFKIVILVWQSSRSRIAGRALATWAPLISILELMVASSDDLWATPINHFDRLCTTDLEQRCEELWTRIPTRTAGFFEVTHTTILERLPELLWAYKSGVPVLRYDKMKVQAIHRTVFDFLIETEGGKKIMEHHTASQEELFIRVFRSCLFRDCLWPEHYFKVTPNGEVINKGSHRWFESGYRLDIHLKSLSTYGYLIQGSVLTEMLDILWNSLVEVNKKLPLHPDSTVNSRVPRCKLDFLLRIAPMGFDAYIRKHIIEWRNKLQFDVLYQVLTACLRPDHQPCNDFEWAGRQHLIERILWNMVSSDRFYFSLPKGLHIRNDTMAKTGISCFLVLAICANRVPCFALPWGVGKTNEIIRLISDFRQLLCFEDRMLITLYLKTIKSDFISFRRHDEFEVAVYVEISMSVLVLIFLRRVAQCDAAFNFHEVEETLNLKTFSQNMKPIMLGVHKGLFLIPSSTDQTFFQKYCQIRLLPELCNPSSYHLEETKRFEDRLAEAVSDASTQFETISKMEEGGGPDGMSFYLCSSCEAREDGAT